MFFKRRGTIKKIKSTFSNTISRTGKGIIVSIGASLLIGSVFGVISLQMADEDKGMKAETTNQTVDVSNQQGEEKTSIETESLSFYVVQAGVFNEKANAKEWHELFKEADYPSAWWKKNQEIYLFAGISAEKDAAKKMVSQMKDDDFEVFVKEWEVQAEELDVNEADANYIESFITSWKQSLNEQDVQALEKFAEENDEVSEDLQPLQEQVIKLLHSKGKHEQEILVETVAMYERVLKNKSK